VKPKRAWLVAVGVALAVLTSACANSAYAPTETGGVPTTATSPALNFAGKGITVFAASSLTDAFTEIGQKFEGETGGGVTFNFGGSSNLRAQLEQGASGDVFASADTDQMSLAKASGVVESEGTVFAHNKLVVIIPKDNPGGIRTLLDLARSGVKVILANSTVPAGTYARAFLTAASADAGYGSDYSEKVMANVVSNASNVKEVASAVQLGEADAGVVYRTDVAAELAKDVTTIEIPDSVNQLATYPIAVTTDAGTKDVAQAFIDFVLSGEGQDILVSHGFIKAAS
jgi:molybdate transport system substrate-binding protein